MNTPVLFIVILLKGGQRGGQIDRHFLLELEESRYTALKANFVQVEGHVILIQFLEGLGDKCI